MGLFLLHFLSGDVAHGETFDRVIEVGVSDVTYLEGVRGDILTGRDHEVVDFTRSRVKNNTELTNFGKLTRIELHNGK